MDFYVLDRYWAQMTVCVKLFSLYFLQKGEHFLEKSRLYLSADRTWGTNLQKASAVPKRSIHRILSYRGSRVQMSESEKKESIRIRWLGTSASVSENGPQNQYDFVGRFF